MAYMRDSDGRRLDDFPVAQDRRDFDVLVYGATEAGVIAAVAAARQGADVLLVSDSPRIGGMTGHALTAQDVLTNRSPGMFQGIVREFFTKVAAQTDAGYFDRWHRRNGPGKPSYYARAFAEILTGQPVALLLDAHLSKVTKTGTTITAATIGDKTYTARVWIDATPTGDVIQRANLSRSIGREGRALYSESLPAGVLTPVGISAGGPVDPYVTPGNAASGTLPQIDTDPVGTIGSGDGRVMTFGWRLFLTSVASEKRPWPTTPPVGYSTQDYELLARLWASDTATFNGANALLATFQVYDLTLGAGTSAVGAPLMQYIDLNSNGFLSSNYPYTDECLEYVTATPARRAEIETKARRWLEGLFYFITQSSDPRVPSNLRTQVNNFGLSNRELVDTTGWPAQFYVREGARLVGDYVMTEAQFQVNDLAYSNAPDYVAHAAYNLDLHPIRVVNDSGAVKVEGGYAAEAANTQVGAPIPYRVLVPKVAECTNMLCPGQPSVSRLMHSAIRAIPILMQLGEAAGYAAAIAAHDGTTVQAVPAAKLQKLLDLKAVNAAAAVIASDASSNQGTRTESGAGAAFATVTTGVRWGKIGAPKSVAAGVDRKVRYQPNIYRDGLYDVFVGYPAAQSSEAAGIKRASNVAVTISHADGTATRVLNQQYPGGNGGRWDLLGRFYFTKGTPSAHYVDINTNGATTDGIVIDDAVKFVLVE